MGGVAGGGRTWGVGAADAVPCSRVWECADEYGCCVGAHSLQVCLCLSANQGHDDERK